MVRDRPFRSRVTNSGSIGAAATSMTVPSAHIAQFQAGQRLEWDDDTDETAVVDTVDPDTFTVSFGGTYNRGVESSTAAVHAENSIVLIEPRFRYLEIADAAQDITESLYPHIHKTGETTLTYESDGHYAPSATDIEEPTLVYQLVGGERYDLEFQWVGPEQAGTGYTNGMLVVPDPVDSSTLYVAYNARITLSNATDHQLRGIALGTAATLAQMEEAQGVAPDRPVSVGRVREGARLQLGAILWERFIDWRNTERLNLLEDELAYTVG